MYLYILYDEVVRPKNLGDELDYLLRTLAYVEAKTRYEVLVQVIELISAAKKKNISLEDLEHIVADWLTDASALYEAILLDEPVFRFILGRVELKKKVETKA